MVVGARRALLKGGGGVSYEAEALALFARFTAPATDARKTLINAVYLKSKADGWFAKLDYLYLLAAETAQAGRQNLVQDAFNASAVNSPAFVADRGYTPDGSSSYLNTNFNPIVAAGKFSLNSASMGIWTRTESATNGYDMGAYNGSNGSLIGARQASGAPISYSNNNIQGVGVAQLSLGHTAWSRNDSAGYKGYKNGVNAFSVTAASAAVASLAFWLGGFNSSGVLNPLSGGRQYSAVYAGSGLSDADEASIHETLNTYLTAIGAA